MVLEPMIDHHVNQYLGYSIEKRSYKAWSDDFDVLAHGLRGRPDNAAAFKLRTGLAKYCDSEEFDMSPDLSCTPPRSFSHKFGWLLTEW